MQGNVELEPYMPTTKSIDRSPLAKSESYSSNQLISLLRIAHKYCMDTIEKDVIGTLKQNLTTAGYVEWIVASQIIDSKDLYDDALKGLIASGEIPDLEQARRIGTDALYAIFTAVPLGSQCKHCTESPTKVRAWLCDHCGKKNP